MATRVVSDVQKIDSDINHVYAFLADFNRICSVINVAREMGGEQLIEVSDKIEDIRSTTDSCTIRVKAIGDVTMVITEREEPKLIKFSDDGGVPLKFNLWIQLLENGQYDTRLRVTFEGELNMMMKMLLKGKLEKGINQLAEGLAKIPYMFLGL